MSTDSPTPPRISVVVLSKNERSLNESLVALRPQCDATGAECIVVDASQQALDDIRLAHPWVRWIDFEAPDGVRVTIPHQRNVGIEAALAPVIAFCDAGGIPAEGWLAALTAPLIARTQVATTGPIEPLGESLFPALNMGPEGTVITDVVTCNFGFRKEVLATIGPFDERLAYGSDVDFGWRLVDADLPTVIVEGAVMRMPWGVGSLQHKRAWRYGRARARLLYLHPERARHIVGTTPEMAVYPVWLLGLVAMIGVTAHRPRRGLLLVLWLALLAIPLWRARSSPRPGRILSDHFIYSFGSVTELALAPFQVKRRAQLDDNQGTVPSDAPRRP